MKLKHCPFCGCTFIVIEEMQTTRRFFYAVCKKCDSMSGSEQSEEMAAKVWNQRVQDKNLGATTTDKTAMISAILQAVGGTVDGRPTNSLNYLQRLRELADKEKEMGE